MGGCDELVCYCDLEIQSHRRGVLQYRPHRIGVVLDVRIRETSLHDERSDEWYQEHLRRSAILVIDPYRGYGSVEPPCDMDTVPTEKSTSVSDLLGRIVISRDHEYLGTRIGEGGEEIVQDLDRFGTGGGVVIDVPCDQHTVGRFVPDDVHYPFQDVPLIVNDGEF